MTGLYGIPRVDLEQRPRWKRSLAWWFGGKALATDRLYRGWEVYEKRAEGVRDIPVLRLTPVGP